MGRLAVDEHGKCDREQAGDLRGEEHAERAERSTLQRPEEVGEAPREARRECECRAYSGIGRVAATASSWFAW